MNKLKQYILGITEFSEESWISLSNCMTEMEFQRKEYLLKEGQICESIYFISSGFCKACYNKDGKEINTEFYFENEFATNIRSLAMGAKSLYFLKACEKLKLVSFDKTKLLEAYTQSPQIETFGRKVLESIIAKQEEHSEIFKLMTPGQRFANMVLKHPDFLQRVSLSQIASYLGISRETLSRLRGLK